MSLLALESLACSLTVALLTSMSATRPPVAPPVSSATVRERVMLLSARALPDGRATDTANNAGSRAISSAARQQAIREQRGPSVARPVSSATVRERVSSTYFCAAP